MFQSTRARGARQNPATKKHHVIVSIHARARRATRNVEQGLCDVVFVSIHARARRATYDECLKSEVFQFQSTRARGARPNGKGKKLERYSFNPRARAARDIGGCGARDSTRCFNPRARAARDDLADND